MDDARGDTFDYKKVFYLSSHLVDSADTTEYGKKRVLRDLLDAWIAKKMSFAGIEFNDLDSALTDAEMAVVPGAQALKSMDSMKLEVLIRNGGAFELHPDEVKKWRAHGGPLATEFDKLLDAHDMTYKNMLVGVAPNSSFEADDQTAEVATETQLAEAPAAATQFESMEALQSQDPIRAQCASELTDIDLLRGASGKVYLLAKTKDKIIPRHTILGGYGTGKLPGCA